MVAANATRLRNENRHGLGVTRFRDSGEFSATCKATIRQEAGEAKIGAPRPGGQRRAMVPCVQHDSYGLATFVREQCTPAVAV